MKILSHFVFLMLGVLSCGYLGAAETTPKLEKLWLREGLPIPESVLFYNDGKAPYLFVSLIDGDPTALDGKGGIAKMSVNGEILAADWVTGLNAPKGMAAFEGMLYVADINEVVVINIKKAAVVKRIPLGALFLNDVAVDSYGVVYVSDTQTNKVHRIKNQKSDVYLSDVEAANGLKTLGSNLVVGAGKNLLLVDKDKNQVGIATGFAEGIDGVESVGRGSFIVSCWPGLVYYVNANGQLDLLLDTQQAKINTADIGYDSSSGIVYIPNFAANSVTAYKLITN